MGKATTMSHTVQSVAGITAPVTNINNDGNGTHPGYAQGRMSENSYAVVSHTGRGAEPLGSACDSAWVKSPLKNGEKY